MAHGYFDGLVSPDRLLQVPRGRAVGGYPIGIVCIDVTYPMVPGNVVNATTYQFPVYIRVLEGVTFPQIAAADPSVCGKVVRAGEELIRLGARAIVGACGSFANYQKDVAAALDVPTFLSIMMHVPLIARALKPRQHVGVICGVAEAITSRVFDQVGIDDPSRMILTEAAGLPEFDKLMTSGCFNSAQLERELADHARRFVETHPSIGAILLQCSDMPPYAAAVQDATGRPVFDMTTLIEWLYRSVVRRPYAGYV